MKTLEINGTGVLYTVKLALHYFRRQFAQDKEASKDQLLVLQSSVAGYLDIPASIQYNFSKFGLRAMMRVLRRTEYQHGIRVNNICPWFVHGSRYTAVHALNNWDLGSSARLSCQTRQSNISKRWESNMPRSKMQPKHYSSWPAIPASMVRLESSD